MHYPPTRMSWSLRLLCIVIVIVATLLLFSIAHTISERSEMPIDVVVEVR